MIADFKSANSGIKQQSKMILMEKKLNFKSKIFLFKKIGNIFGKSEKFFV